MPWNLVHIIGTVSILTVTVTALVLGSIDKHCICHCGCGWLDLKYFRLKQFNYRPLLIKYIVLYHTIYPCCDNKYKYLRIHDLYATIITIRERYTMVPKMHHENKAFFTLLWAWQKCADATQGALLNKFKMHFYFASPGMKAHLFHN